MTSEEADGQLLDEYLAGQLSPEEEAALQAKAKQNPDFARLLELYRMERETIDLALTEQLRSKIDSWDTSPPPPLPKLGVAFRWWYLLGIPLTGALIWLLKPNTSQPTPAPSPPPAPAPAVAPDSSPIPQDTPAALDDQRPAVFADNTLPESPPPTRNEGPQLLALATEAYTIPPALGGTLRSSAADTTTFTTGKRLFTEGEYAAALDHFNSISSQEQPNTYLRALQWRAHALFKLSRFDEGEAVFAELTAITSGLAKERAEWYRALSLLAAGNKSEAKQLLSQLEAAGENHIFSGPAKKILLELKK